MLQKFNQIQKTLPVDMRQARYAQELSSKFYRLAREARCSKAHPDTVKSIQAEGAKWHGRARAYAGSFVVAGSAK